MAFTTSKLEMSLDEIIESQKRKNGGIGVNGKKNKREPQAVLQIKPKSSAFVASPRRQQQRFVKVGNYRPVFSVRAQINAMRRASRVQQLQKKIIESRKRKSRGIGVNGKKNKRGPQTVLQIKPKSSAFVASPRRQQQRFVKMGNDRPVLSVRAQINAMRRASRVQQLQSQFVKQQSQPVQIIQQRQSRGFRPQNQVIRRRPQRLTQYIVVQQPQQGPRRQFVKMQNNNNRGARFYAQKRGQPRPQQQFIKMDPFYDPPNFLQRL